MCASNELKVRLLIMSEPPVYNHDAYDASPHVDGPDMRVLARGRRRRVLGALPPPCHTSLSHPLPVNILLLSSIKKNNQTKRDASKATRPSLALRKERPRVELLDLDVFGPTLPTFLGLLGGKDKGKGRERESKRRMERRRTTF